MGLKNTLKQENPDWISKYNSAIFATSMEKFGPLVNRLEGGHGGEEMILCLKRESWMRIRQNRHMSTINRFLC